jgi:hypothetical protein
MREAFLLERTLRAFSPHISEAKLVGRRESESDKLLNLRPPPSPHASVPV